MEEHLAQRGGGVDVLIEHYQVHPTSLQLFGQLDEVFQRPAAAIELGNQELIALAGDQ